MYIAITPQKLEGYQSSVSDYVTYLEKENDGLETESKTLFFNQTREDIYPEEVINEIDNNTYKLKQTEARFYSVVISPGPKELNHIKNDPEKLKAYTREVMKAYAQSFNRDPKITVDQLKYYAKIEHQRTYRGFEKEIQENASYRKQIARLQNNIQKVERGELEGNIKKMKKEIKRLEKQAPYKRDGKLIKEGMLKQGNQTHVHIIVSRNDVTNRKSLSPMSKHKASEVELHGKKVQ